MIAAKTKYSAVLALLLLSHFPATAATCSTRVLDKPPSWISTVALDASDILIANPREGKLLAYNVITHATNVISSPEASAVTKIMGGFLIQGQDKGAILGS